MNENAPIFQRIKSLPFLKEHFGWKLCFCWHPMYLLVDEDRGTPTIGERVEPWGSLTAAAYVDKVRGNLASLRRIDGLALNYQFSGVEMEALAAEFPDVAGELSEQFQAGRLDFIGGTFAQPHLHAFDAESNWRQFEYGLAVFEKLFGKRIVTYARQETGLHRQLPQLLAKFGFEFLVTPNFGWTMEVIDGSYEINNDERSGAQPGHEFVDAAALDGTSLPMYMATNIGATNWIDQLSNDLYSASPIWIDFPDMIPIAPTDGTKGGISKERLDEWMSVMDISLLESALRERLAATDPKRPRVQVHSYWSYMEGVWAEELLRANKRAVDAALMAEAAVAVVDHAGQPVSGAAETIREIWHTLLKYQHHDIYWIEVTDLRRRAIEKIDRAKSEAEALLESAATTVSESTHDPELISVFNPILRRRRALLDVPANALLPAGGLLQVLDDRAIGWVDLPGGAFTTMPCGGQAQDAHDAPLPETITTEHCKIALTDDGLIEQIQVDDHDVLPGDGRVGGLIRAMIDDEWCDNRNSQCRFFDGPVASVIERTGQLGPIPLRERLIVFKHGAVIKGEIEFEFDHTEAGLFWLDETKINVYWPTTGGTVRHDIPFGYIDDKPNRPLFAPNWVHLGRMAYVNRGTVKHWVRDGQIANVLAWGGRSFSNRIHRGWMDKEDYDIRLDGHHQIEYFVIPGGEFDGPAVARAVEDLTGPLFVSRASAATEPIEIDAPGLSVTSLGKEAGELRIRGVQLPTEPTGRLRDWEIFDVPLADLQRSS